LIKAKMTPCVFKKNHSKCR